MEIAPACHLKWASPPSCVCWFFPGTLTSSHTPNTWQRCIYCPVGVGVRAASSQSDFAMNWRLVLTVALTCSPWGTQRLRPEGELEEMPGWKTQNTKLHVQSGMVKNQGCLIAYSLLDYSVGNKGFCNTWPDIAVDLYVLLSVGEQD